MVTTQSEAAFKLDPFLIALEALSSRKINMADAAAAAILHKSPIFTDERDIFPSKDSRNVPHSAVKADIQVDSDICRPSSAFAKNGTNLTLRYSKNPDLCAVVNYMSVKAVFELLRY